MSNISILEALEDPKIFGPFFRGPSWDAWKAFLAALFALPMTVEQLATYTKHTGRKTPPTAPSHEAWLVIGRRGGKSFILAAIAVYLAAFKDWSPYIGLGRGTIMIIAADRRQGRIIKRYISGLLNEIEMLRPLVEADLDERVDLKSGITIEIHTASHVSTRGYLIIAALVDEIAYLPADESSAERDVEVLNAVKPGMATVPEAMLLCASSPYARRGAMWEAYQKHYAKDGDPILVWQASTREMNPSVPQSFIDQHMAEDPSRALAEYNAIFRTDRERFAMREIVQACVGDHYEIGPSSEHSYTFAVDPAGGSGEDSFGACVMHREGNIVITDAVREIRPPFSPEAVVGELATLAKSYRCSRVTGDRWGGEFPREAFRKHGLSYEPSKIVKSDLYVNLLPLLNSRRIVLPRNDRLFNQIISLERRAVRGGHDTVDHPVGHGQHDDAANAVALAASLVAFNTNSLFGPDERWTGYGETAPEEGPQNPHQTYEDYAKKRDSIRRPAWVLELMGKKKSEDVDG